MTDEEAKKIIKQFRDRQGNSDEDVEALDMAIKALEQQPNGDCISRKAVKEMLMKAWTKYMPMELDMNLSFVLEKISELPSVTPKARWIPVSERLPEQDKTGCLNWHSVKVFAQIKNYAGETEIVKGFFIKYDEEMVFELDEFPLIIPEGWDFITLDKDNRAYDEDCPEEYVELQAWMPLPQPYGGN